ncbi:MAG: capsule biosynthesis protein CapK [Alistipes sp.]|nr:capsule biosynthesis protein CapK [Alistipes sp.]
MVIIIRCNDILSDPRAMKYVRYLQDNSIEHKLIGWDRDGKNLELANSVMWKEQAGYNVGGFKAVKNRIGWMWFVYRQLCKMKPKDAIIHGCDVDSAFPAACYKLFHSKNKLIFDVFDWFSATLYNQKTYILAAFKFMEKFTVKHSDRVILCEQERIVQIPFKVSRSKLSILPNIPYFENDMFLKVDSTKRFDNDLITFSYVGGFSTDRCLFEIVSLAEKGLINLSIAGFGLLELEERLKKDNEILPNIRYYGKVKYEDGLNISYNSDVMYAMYQTVNPNNIYAAPNKYYEAMFLGKPLFTTKGTIVEKKVLDRNMGYVSGESEEEIASTIKSIELEDMTKKGLCARECWVISYKNYTNDYLNNEYLKF